MKARNHYALYGRVLPVLGSLLVTPVTFSQVDDYEFMPADAWAGRAETGEDDASMALAEGFQGIDEVRRNTAIEPVDGSGGLDNVAPQLSVEEGPGGLEWDPSPTYRTRYKGSQDYPAGTSQLQGNNWFTKIPTFAFYSPGNQYWIRFDANTFRKYDFVSGQTWAGRYGNNNSRFIQIQTGQFRLYDTRGKTYYFNSTGRCTQIEGIGGARITIDYSVQNQIKVFQKPSLAGAEVRRIIYYLNVAGTRIARIEVEDVATATIYRKIFFTYHEDVAGAVQSTTGDLIGIQDEKLLSPAATWYKRRWIFRYYTGSWDDTLSPGYQYQVKSVLGPESYNQFLKKNSVSDTYIYTLTTEQLEAWISPPPAPPTPENFIDRKYEYASDKRVRKQDIKGGCGCGGGEGVYTYAWDVNGSEPGDFITWYRSANITLPTANGSKRIIDYNKYGQTLNWIAQEVAGDSNSRRWIRTWVRDANAMLTESNSVKACASYNDLTHVVTKSDSAGQRFLFSATTVGNETTVTTKLRDPGSGNLNFQRKKIFLLVASGSRKRVLKTSDTVYPLETISDSGGVVTSYSYTYHSPTDALAVQLRTTTLPVIPATENGPGNGPGDAFVVKNWFELNGLNTWTRDPEKSTPPSPPYEGEVAVHYRQYDTSRRTLTKTITNINTSLPGSPTPPTGFATTQGANLVTEMEYDWLRRITKQVAPEFNDNTNTAVKTTKQWYYTKLSTDELVTLEYPHVTATEYFHAPIDITLYDHEGHVLSSARGVLRTGFKNTTLSDDFVLGQPTLELGFHGPSGGPNNPGILVRRTDYGYDGDKVVTKDVWLVASSSSSAKYTTTHEYDLAGRRTNTIAPTGTVTRLTYDILDRKKTTKIGTVVGGPADETLVEELFYDDEENNPANVGDGNLTRVRRYTDVSVFRETDYTFDYRQRLTQTDEPGSVRETRQYQNAGGQKTNRTQPDFIQRYDTSAGSTLTAKTENLFDSWGRIYEVRTYGVVSGAESGYLAVKTWRNGRGSVMKTLGNVSVLSKTQYDGAGRVTDQAIGYDTAETTYGDAFNLTNDVVIEEAKYAFDKAITTLVKRYQRNHDALLTSTGPLTTAVARAQYRASWHDKLQRVTHVANYGTNGGTDLATRPSLPPSASSATVLLSTTTYRIKAELDDSTPPYDPPNEIVKTADPMGIVTQAEYDDPGRLVKRVNNYADGVPGPASDVDRTMEMTYNGSNALLTVTEKAAGYDSGTQTYYDLVTANEYGVVKGTDNSKITSNDLLKRTRYPDPDTVPIGQPSADPNDQELFGYNAQGELIWRRDQNLTEHTLTYDSRGRLTNDVVTGDETKIDTSIMRIGRTFDALDRPLLTTSYNGSGGILNQSQLVYDKYSTVTTYYQEHAGAVNAGSSRKVEFAHQFPGVNGTPALRRTSTTYPEHPTITTTQDFYAAGIDDTISRISGRQRNPMVFQDSFLGSGRLVKRKYGDTGTPVEWTLVGFDAVNNDNYVGLDRFGRIDRLIVKNTSSGVQINGYVHTYNYNSDVTLRETLPSQLYEYYFDEGFSLDNRSRITDHKRGDWNGSSWDVALFAHECWTVDRSSNNTQYYSGGSTGCTPATATFTYNASNEITAKNGNQYYAQFTDVGNQKVKGGPGSGRYDNLYDGWNRLVEIKLDNVVISRYSYDGSGHKIRRTQSSQPDLDYYYNLEGQVIEERVVGGNRHYIYVWGTHSSPDPVFRENYFGGQEYFVHDARHNIITRMDGTGLPLARFVFDGYGAPKQLSSDWSTWQTITEDLNLLRGRRWHKEHSYYTDKWRFYDPDPGIFLQWRDYALVGCGFSHLAACLPRGGAMVGGAGGFTVPKKPTPVCCPERFRVECYPVPELTERTELYPDGSLVTFYKRYCDWRIEAEYDGGEDPAGGWSDIDTQEEFRCSCGCCEVTAEQSGQNVYRRPGGEWENVPIAASDQIPGPTTLDPNRWDPDWVGSGRGTDKDPDPCVFRAVDRYPTKDTREGEEIRVRMKGRISIIDTCRDGMVMEQKEVEMFIIGTEGSSMDINECNCPD